MNGRCYFCGRVFERCRCDYRAATRLFRILLLIVVIGALIKVFG